MYDRLFTDFAQATHLPNMCGFQPGIFQVHLNWRRNARSRSQPSFSPLLLSMLKRRIYLWWTTVKQDLHDVRNVEDTSTHGVDLYLVDPNGNVICVAMKPKVRTISATHLISSLTKTLDVVSTEFFCNLDANLMRLDHLQRPELNKGTVDFVVPEAYWANPPPISLTPSYYSVDGPSTTPRKPQSMNYMFILDVSMEAVQSGFLRTSCNSIRKSLYGWSADDGVEREPCIPRESHVGILAFDSALYFYNLSVSTSIRLYRNPRPHELLSRT